MSAWLNGMKIRYNVGPMTDRQYSSILAGATQGMHLARSRTRFLRRANAEDLMEREQIVKPRLDENARLVGSVDLR